MSLDPPGRGLIFWPVGTGDSTTIVVDEDTRLQVDLNHLSSAEEDDDPHAPIIDDLKEILPRRSGKPYLSTFALTHPDQDHCRGFERLLGEVTIGEIWFTPRVFKEYKKDLCDDAQTFRDEARRRVRATIDAGGDPGAGNRVRIIGYDDLLQEEDYEGFPNDRLTVPGHEITQIDGEDVGGIFRAFVHAPFKEDADGDRNDTSLGMQVTLTDADDGLRSLLLGDLSYPPIRRIFDRSRDDDLRWNVFLAPHHCSKSVMYWKDEGEDEEQLKQDILDDLERVAETDGYVVASSEPVPSSNEPGDNPPHAKAKDRYEEIVPQDFLCTQEHGSEDHPTPIVFEIPASGSVYREAKIASATSATIPEAVARARGQQEAPGDQVGFGNQ